MMIRRRRYLLIGLYFDTNKCILFPTAMGDIRQLKKLYDDDKLEP